MAHSATKQTNAFRTSYYARTPDGLLVDERLPGSTSYNPIYDSNGDLIGLLNTSGALAQTIRYGPYGENTNTAGSTSYSVTNDSFLFQGGYHLSGGNTGSGNVGNNLYHFGDRTYDPTTGRWTQVDSLKQIGSLGASVAFSFADNDPINQTDPTGDLSIFGLHITTPVEKAVELARKVVAKYGIDVVKLGKLLGDVGCATTIVLIVETGHISLATAISFAASCGPAIVTLL